MAVLEPIMRVLFKERPHVNFVSGKAVLIQNVSHKTALLNMSQSEK